MGVNWALVEYSSDDRNMYDIEIRGWSTFQFSLNFVIYQKMSRLWEICFAHKVFVW